MVGSLHSPLLPLTSWIQKVLLRWIGVFFIICYKITIQPVSILCKNQNIIFRLKTIHTSSLFVIFPWLLTKNNIRVTPEALQMNRSSCFNSYSVHISLTLHLPFTLRSRSICTRVSFVLAFAVRLHSVFAHRSPFTSAQSALSGTVFYKSLHVKLSSP